MRLMLATGGLVLVWSLWVTAYKEGPLPGMTGGFGEPTCVACHFDHPLNQPPGSLRLTGLPRTYTPGGHYTITITLARQGLKLGGFELSARFAGGTIAGRQAGALAPADSRTQLVSSIDGALQYVQHNKNGNRPPEPGRLAWAVGWTAPIGTTGPVVFHAAGNAANNDDSPLGDYIYLTEATVK